MTNIMTPRLKSIYIKNVISACISGSYDRGRKEEDRLILRCNYENDIFEQLLELLYSKERFILIAETYKHHQQIILFEVRLLTDVKNSGEVVDIQTIEANCVVTEFKEIFNSSIMDEHFFNSRDSKKEALNVFDQLVMSKR